VPSFIKIAWKLWPLDRTDRQTDIHTSDERKNFSSLAQSIIIGLGRFCSGHPKSWSRSRKFIVSLGHGHGLCLDTKGKLSSWTHLGLVLFETEAEKYISSFRLNDKRPIRPWTRCRIFPTYLPLAFPKYKWPSYSSSITAFPRSP